MRRLWPEATRLFKALQVCVEESVLTGGVALILMPMLNAAAFVECAASCSKILGLFCVLLIENPNERKKKLGLQEIWWLVGDEATERIHLLKGLLLEWWTGLLLRFGSSETKVPDS